MASCNINGIDYRKFKPLISHIRLSNGRNCSDGLCCFQPPNEEGENVNPIGDNWDFSLIVGSILYPRPEKGQELTDLLTLPNLKIK